MSGIIGRKIGMTSVFDEKGDNIPCTVIQAGPNIVTQVKRADGKDAYDAVQLGFGEKKLKRTTKALQGHFEAAGATMKQTLKEFHWADDDVELGDEILVDDLFEEGEIIDVAGTSKGKGFQGVVRRHGFSGVGDRTHDGKPRLLPGGEVVGAECGRDVHEARTVGVADELRGEQAAAL